MSQVRSIAIIGTGSAVQQAAEVLKAHPELAQPIEQEKSPAPPPKKPLTAAERRPDLYIRDQKLDAMSNAQLRGELNRATRQIVKRMPHELQLNDKTGAVKAVDRPSLTIAALGIALKIMLDNHKRGMSPFPR